MRRLVWPWFTKRAMLWDHDSAGYTEAHQPRGQWLGVISTPALPFRGGSPCSCSRCGSTWLCPHAVPLHHSCTVTCWLMLAGSGPTEAVKKFLWEQRHRVDVFFPNAYCVNTCSHIVSQNVCCSHGVLVWTVWHVNYKGLYDALTNAELRLWRSF